MIAPLASTIRQRVAEDLAGHEASSLTGDDRKEFARQRAFLHLDALSDSGDGGPHAELTHQEEQRLAQTVLDALFGLGRLQVLVDDPDIENIDINGCDRVWATFADGSKRLMDPVAESDDELVELIRSAAGRFGLSERRFDTARPELDLQLPGGARLSALMAVSARPSVSIRRHRFADLSLDDLCSMGALDSDLRSLLSAAVRARKNIVVSGAMNSGKTTLLRALAAEIDPRERIVTIEQAFELGLDTGSGRHPDIVALEARPANIEGEGRIPVADLVRRSLRMNADRVIVGEVLGDEVLPMLNAMSQGRSGSMCTIHAESSAGVFRRIASYAVQAPERLPLEATNLLISGALHFVVHLDSEMHDHPAIPAVVTGPASRRTGRRSLFEIDGSDGSDGPDRFDGREDPLEYFPARGSRARFVSSVREVVDAEGVQVVSNEIYRPGPDRRSVPASPLRAETVDELGRFGFELPRVAWSGSIR
ncbi:MAG: ATPase, T2SS/T4P/T4SS family [Acidimicrobiales bacterium]|jgi:Flp pilus assembly CpaF family ATPase